MPSSGQGASRRTKIVATVGPASRDPEILRQLFEAGVDVFRLNFAHGTPDEHAETVRRIRQISEEVGREVGILGDLPGPKLRLGELEGDVAVLHSGSTVRLRGETNGDRRRRTPSCSRCSGMASPRRSTRETRCTSPTAGCG